MSASTVSPRRAEHSEVGLAHVDHATRAGDGAKVIVHVDRTSIVEVESLSHDAPRASPPHGFELRSAAYRPSGRLLVGLCSSGGSPNFQRRALPGPRNAKTLRVDIAVDARDAGGPSQEIEFASYRIAVFLWPADGEAIPVARPIELDGELPDDAPPVEGEAASGVLPDHCGDGDASPGHYTCWVEFGDAAGTR